MGQLLGKLGVKFRLRSAYVSVRVHEVGAGMSLRGWGRVRRYERRKKMRAPRFKRGNKRRPDRQECALLRVGRAASKMQRYGGVIIKENADLCERVRYADRERQTDIGGGGQGLQRTQTAAGCF